MRVGSGMVREGKGVSISTKSRADKIVSVSVVIHNFVSISSTNFTTDITFKDRWK
jgi:hypothetical protein